MRYDSFSDIENVWLRRVALICGSIFVIIVLVLITIFEMIMFGYKTLKEYLSEFADNFMRFWHD